MCLGGPGRSTLSRYTLSGDKLFYIVRQYLTLRANSRLVLVRAIPIQMLVSPSLVPNLRSLNRTYSYKPRSHIKAFIPA
ncbi:hypothetical protein BHM03_00005698 [Ensete ventricosum]|nr:hypothetical protein BHM03_00005698 [Ensete ventricosum]